MLGDTVSGMDGRSCLEGAQAAYTSVRRRIGTSWTEGADASPVVLEHLRGVHRHGYHAAAVGAEDSDVVIEPSRLG